MKVIFLDFDGVLNSERYVKEHGPTRMTIDPARMVLLKKLINATDAKVVLSTSWRRHWSLVSEQCDKIGQEINALFRKNGIEIYDKIPECSYKREKEIEKWLEDYPQVKNFVVLDDLFLSSPKLKGRCVKTAATKNGIEESDVKKAIKILNG